MPTYKLSSSKVRDQFPNLGNGYVFVDDSLSLSQGVVSFTKVTAEGQEIEYWRCKYQELLRKLEALKSANQVTPSSESSPQPPKWEVTMTFSDGEATRVVFASTGAAARNLAVQDARMHSDGPQFSGALLSSFSKEIK